MENNNFERRYVEIRANDERTISGSAIVFNSESRDMGFIETISPDAISPELIMNSDIVCLYNHNENAGILARSNKGKGTMKINITDKSVDFGFKARNTALGDEILSAVKSADLSSCSFAFRIAEDGDVWEQRDGQYYRTINKIEVLRDFSIVSSPAYEETSCRSFDEFKTKEIEDRAVVIIVDGKEPEVKADEVVVEEPTKSGDTQTDEVKAEEPKKSGDTQTDEVEVKSSDINKTENVVFKTTTEKNNLRNMNEKFSLVKTIRDIVENRGLSETSINTIDAGKIGFTNTGLSVRGQIVLPMEVENRASIVASNYGDSGLLLGQEIVATEKLNLIGALRANSVVFSAGANLLSGLVGNVSIPKYAGTTSDWKYEVSGATEGAGAFSEIELAPKRLTTVISISKQFLLQDSVSAESLLYADLTQSIMDKLEATIFDATAVSQIRPAGIFNGASYTSSGTTTWPLVVGMESAVAASNALSGSLAYIVHPTTMGVLKTTAKASNQAIFIADGKSMNGYPVHVTSHMPTVSGAAKGALFANFNDLIVGSWGNAIDITVDPYTSAASGMIRLIVNSYWDFAKRRTESFSYGALA